MLIFKNDEMKVHSLALGPLRTNCYIIENRCFSFIIDPVGKPDVIASYLSDNNINIEFCLATHGHFDHVGAAAHLIDNKLCDTLYIHSDDAVELRRCNTYSLLLDKKPIKLPDTKNIVWFNETITQRLSSASFNIKHLASHTRGSSIFYTDDHGLLFSGDIILRQGEASKSRCKIGESKEDLYNAHSYIAQKFKPETLLFPGHGKIMCLNSKYALKEHFQIDKE
jgi:hydroxyacylglutathione hydrolase